MNLNFKTGKKYDIVAVAHAIVDILAYVDQKFLDRHGLVKGSMQLIDTERAEYLYQYMRHIKVSAGGSASNTVAGLASFGAKSAIIARVKDDELGAVYKRDIGSAGVDFCGTTAKDGAPTARCIIAVSKEDADRTMSTYLGAAVEMTKEDMNESAVRDSTILYYEGYLLDKEGSTQALQDAIRLSHKYNHIVAMSLSDSRCVAQHRDIVKQLVSNVDLVFANEDEVKTLFNTSKIEQAVAEIARICKLAVVTQGSRGSLVICGEERYHIPPCQNIGVIVDTTGAGDLYASGFLYGMIRGYDLEKCGKLGSLSAAEIISHLGAKPAITLSSLLQYL